MESIPNISGEQPAEKIIPVIREEATISKEVVEGGGLRVRKTVLEEELPFETELKQEELSIERVPMNQYVETAPGVRYEGEVMIVPVLKEVIEKRLVLVEELRITRKTESSVVKQTVILRQEHVSVERFDEPEMGRKNK